jgi:hypothetical protein
MMRMESRRCRLDRLRLDCRLRGRRRMSLYGVVISMCDEGEDGRGEACQQDSCPQAMI